MKENKTVVALLTGRGNNTLKDKNVLDILGHPVLYYPATAGNGCEYIDGYYCSSDDEKILKAAEESGYERIVRPAELAAPTAQHVDCIIHGLKEIRERGVNPDIIVVLLANNVTVKPEWITDCIDMMVANPSLTSVVPVYKDNDHHPLRAKSLNSDGLLEMYEKGVDKPLSTNRQDLPPCYFLSHNFWVLRTDYLDTDMSDGQQPWSFMGPSIAPYEIEESIDIHDEEDLVKAANWLKMQGL